MGCFPGRAVVKNLPTNAGDTRDTSSVPGLERERGKGNPRVLGNKVTQKDNADSEVQFITPAGPRQSPLLAKDPNQSF